MGGAVRRALSDCVGFTFYPDASASATQSTQYDPSNLDFRIWLGWSDVTDHIYVAGILIDDVFKGDSEIYPLYFVFQDHISLMIDGDHDGSPRQPSLSCRSTDCGTDQAAQWYDAIPVSPETPNLDLRGIEVSGVDWWSHPPFGDGGGAVGGERPVVWVTEFYATPFDMLIMRQPEASQVSGLSADKIIGFRIWVGDHDGGRLSAVGVYALGSFPGTLGDLGFDADSWSDGLLMPSESAGDDISVVRDATWGRIKSSLE